MSAAVQKRQRALTRERANVGRHAGKKSSKQLREASHGLEGKEEKEERQLDALLKARQTGGPIVVALEEISDVEAASKAAGRGEVSKGAAAWRRMKSVRAAVRPLSAVESHLAQLETEAQAQVRERQKAAAFERSRPKHLSQQRKTRNNPLLDDVGPIRQPINLDEDDDGEEEKEIEIEMLAPAQLLPGWFMSRWDEAVGELRSADHRLARALGRKPTMTDLERTEEAALALEVVERLRQMREVMLSGEQRAEEEVDTFVRYGSRGADVPLDDESFGPGHQRRASQQQQQQQQQYDESSGEQHHHQHQGLFSGYSRELLRLRQQLSRANERSAIEGKEAAAKVQFLLAALAQRARADASVLQPPPLLPGVTSLSEEDPQHAKYMWLCERPARMEALASAIGVADAAGSADDDATLLLLSTAEALAARRKQFEVTT